MIPPSRAADRRASTGIVGGQTVLQVESGAFNSMSHELDPKVGRWYRRLDDEQLFKSRESIDVDEGPRRNKNPRTARSKSLRFGRSGSRARLLEAAEAPEDYVDQDEKKDEDEEESDARIGMKTTMTTTMLTTTMTTRNTTRTVETPFRS